MCVSKVKAVYRPGAKERGATKTLESHPSIVVCPANAAPPPRSISIVPEKVERLSRRGKGRIGGGLHNNWRAGREKGGITSKERGLTCEFGCARD